MAHETEVIEKFELIFSAEGHEKPFSEGIEPTTTVAAFALLAGKAAHLEGLLEVSLEEADAPLHGNLILIEHLGERFAPIHVSRPGLIHTTVNYNGKQAHEEFRPNVTIERITAWAIDPKVFNLDGGPSDYQIKHNGNVQPPGRHLGQVAHGHKKVELELVWKLKPQGQG